MKSNWICLPFKKNHWYCTKNNTALGTDRFISICVYDKAGPSIITSDIYGYENIDGMTAKLDYQQKPFPFKEKTEQKTQYYDTCATVHLHLKLF